MNKKVYHIVITPLTKLCEGEYIKHNDKWKTITEISISKGIKLGTSEWIDKDQLYKTK